MFKIDFPDSFFVLLYELDNFINFLLFKLHPASGEKSFQSFEGDF